MEPAPVNLDGPTYLVSSPTPPSIGIRAVPSRDDSDGETSTSNEIESKGYSSSGSRFVSDSDNEAEEEEEGVALENPLLEFSTPRVQVPIAKVTADEDEEDDNELVIGVEDEIFAVKNVTPKVRASGVEELDFGEEEEGFETASEDAKTDDLLEDYGSVEEDVVDEATQMNSVAGEAALVISEVVNQSDVKFTSESDATVDSVVMNLREEEDAVAEPVSADLEAVVESDIKVTHEEEVETNGAKFTIQGDSVVDKINVDVVEAIRTGVAVIGEHDALKGVEAKENDSAVDGSVKTELGSSSHDNDHVDDVAEKEAVFEGPTSNEDEVFGRDNEKVQQGHTADDTNDCGLDNQYLNKSIDDHNQEIDEESLEGSTDGEMDGLVFGGSATAKQFMHEMEQAQQNDGQIVTDSEEEADSDNEQDGKELFDSTAFAALLKAAANGTSQDGTRLFSVDRPAGLGPLFRPVRPPARASVFTSPGASAVSEEKLTEEDRNKLEKLQQLRMKFIRLIYRLGHSVEDSAAAHVLYRLALIAGRPSVPSFSLEVAKETALKLEEEGIDDLNFSLNILVLGKSGVGKSATINSIFGEEKVRIDAFEPATTVVNEISGIVNGVKIRVIDTPGLRSSGLEQGFNNKVLASVKKFTKKFTPDIVLYVDRLDSQTKDLNDLPMLRTITSSLGSSIWRNAIVALTHAGCAPPDGPSGSPLSYEVFVGQRSHIVQQYIGQAVGDFRFILRNPISLVENHNACRKNREGEKVLPNGHAWKPQLMLMCFSMKILSEATSVSKPRESLDQYNIFGVRARSLSLPLLLSSLLQPRAHPKLASDDQGGDDVDVDSDIDLDDYSDLEEEEDEYDQLPPFKPLRKAQIAKLSKDQRKAYLEEYDYRVKLLQKKQWKDELKRMRGMKKNKGAAANNTEAAEDYDQESEAQAAVPVPLHDQYFVPTFDADNTAYRYYHFMEPTPQFVGRPVVDIRGWDHDCGFDGVTIDKNLGIAGRFPAAVSVQVKKDKKDFNLHLNSCVAAKHGENGASMVGFDIQSIGRQLGYIVRGETKYKKLKKNKMAAGASVTFLGENVATGLKVEDQISVGKRLVFVGSTGTVRSDKDAAYGANLEIRLRDVDHPIGQDQSWILLSLMKWNGDIALSANLQSQVSIGRNSKMAFHVALNNKLNGQISVRTSSSDHSYIALAGLIPIALTIFRRIRPGVNQDYVIY